MKLKAILLISALWMPEAARAEPVSAFFFGVQTALAGAAIGAGVTVSSAFAVGYSVTTFLTGSALGAVLLSVAVSAGLAALKRPSAPTIEDARVNTRLNNATRWQAAGSAIVGGAAGIFGEHDADGNLWFIVAHADAEMVGPPRYFLDGIEVTLSDGTDDFTAGDVLTDDFCLTTGGDQYEGSGTRLPIWRIYTVSPSAASVTGTLPAAFVTAFPELPSDFFLAGVAYSVIRGRSISAENYSKAYRWRGAIGVGEPNVAVYANWNRMYDPRNVAHDINDAATWTASDGNPAIIWAWWRTHPFGRSQPIEDINWTQVEQAANVCDQGVIDLSAEEVARYRGGFAFADNRPRHECEQDILATMDGFVAYDDEGKAYPVPGIYVAPTLTFNDQRDILSAETQVIDDGEAALDGVIVEFMSPDHGFQRMPSAPWQNATYYDGIREPNYQTIPILGCQNHNQAVRLAKAIGQRLGASRRAALGTTIKGILAKGQRVVTVEYDANFDGPHEIVTPVEEDGSGQVCRFAVVPVDANRWNLLEGEEGAPPAPTPALDIDNSLELAANVIVSAVSVATSSGAAVRLQTTFDAPARLDRLFRFRYALTGETVYQYFTTDMDQLIAFSAIVDDAEDYDVSWQTITAGGRATDWSASVTITSIADPIAPADLVAFSAADGVGQSVISFTTANDARQARVLIYRNTVDTLGSATLIELRLAGPNMSDSYTDAGLTAGTYYYWGVPANGSGVSGDPSPSDTATIS